MLRYIYDTFEDKISRFVSEEKKSINVDNKEVILDIWDTAGKHSKLMMYRCPVSAMGDMLQQEYIRTTIFSIILS